MESLRISQASAAQTAWLWSPEQHTTTFSIESLSNKHYTDRTLWANELLIPAYISLASILAVLYTFVRAALQKRSAPLLQNHTDESYVTRQGGHVSLAFKLSKLFSTVLLAIFSGLAMIRDDRIFVTPDSPEKNRLRHLSIVLASIFSAILVTLSLITTVKVGRTLSSAATCVTLSIWLVYTIRDIWPLATFTLIRHDTHEGWVFWAKYTAASLAGVVLPLCSPRTYIPVDATNPSQDPAPEQTASWLSLMLFNFLDPLVFRAWSAGQLTEEEIPPLADYDATPVLVEKSYPILDTFSGAPKTHVAWGLIRVFRFEFSMLIIFTVLRVLTNFASPIGINQLLSYLETKGEGAVVRPWVWAAWLFLGPFLGSVIFQAYIFLNTRTLVRCEAIITQLVFDHALRIRMKADSSSSPEGTTAPPTRTASPSRTAGEASEAGDAEEGDTLLGASVSTVQAPSQPDLGKGKARTQAMSEATSATAAGPTPSQAVTNPVTKDEKKKKDDDDEAGSNLVGKINNLVTTDLGNITEGRDFIMLIVWAPLELALSMWFLYYFLGWSAFVGLAVMLILMPLPGYLAKVMQTLQAASMKKTDIRVSTITETMNVLRMVKLFGWERRMDERVGAKREDELAIILKRKLTELASNNVNYVIPLAHMVACYFTFTVIMKRPLSASIVFSTMSVFTVLREQLWMVLQLIPMLVRAKVSVDRVNVFLHETELLDEFAAQANGTDVVTAAAAQVDADNQTWFLGIRNASFGWSVSLSSSGTTTPGSVHTVSTVSSTGKREFKLRIDGVVSFKRGGVNLIIGPTGSGKTSMLMALLGEMHFEPTGLDSRFSLPRTGGVAYAAQESWVQNESIRENIVFGAPWDEARYKKVIYQCGLSRDLTLFEAGDKTEVGEKGLTLSGGQKARITLARAVYSSAEIVLLDDVLAALDVHTAKHIVEKCFRGDLLKGRTVLLVTHNVALTTGIADFVVSLGIDGRVRSQGTVDQALSRDSRLKAEVAQEKKELEGARNGEGSEGPNQSEEQEAAMAGDGKLIMKEEVAEGHVSWAALQLYFSSMAGKWHSLFWISIVVGSLACESLNSLQTWFLGYWARQYDLRPSEEISVAYYLGVYGAMLGVAVIFYVSWVTIFTFGQLRASRTLHERLIKSVLGTTLRWLDTTPTSRIIARCTRDIRAVDSQIPEQLGALFDLSAAMITRLAGVVILTPIFIVPGFLLAVIGGFCGQLYIKAQLGVKRHMSVAHAPVLGHFGAAINGMVSIRAYGATEAFKKESMIRINRYTRAARSFYNLNRWICIRIDALGGLFAASLAAYLVYGRDIENASDTGFSITMAVVFSGMILWWVRVLNEFEVAGNSLERIQEYTVIEQEPKASEGGTPPAYWPASGDLRVEKLCARYSADGPRVLHEVSFHIKSGERVGVVGRTGSGKSSLTLSLLRCINTEGDVYFDGLPTSSMNLESLREKVTIIPQVPELLSGSLRQNLDPFGQHDDIILNEALRAAGLFALQEHDTEEAAARLTLDSTIASGGGNLSVGQRQILALARALVRQSKLLILDEATSAIDYETDTIIQTSLRRALQSDITVIIVAHRLQTIMDADKIMVLDAGKLVEFDSPAELLKNEKGLLRSLVDESGDKELLYSMASKPTKDV